MKKLSRSVDSLVFVDSAKDYDSVPLDKLSKTLEDLRIESNIVKPIKEAVPKVGIGKNSFR